MWVARTVVVLVLLLAGGALVPYFESMDTVVADNVKLVDGTWIAKGDLATFPTKAQKAINEKGLGSVEDADKLEPEPRFKRMKELGFIPSDAEFAGTNMQGEVLYTTPTAFSHLEGAELERVFKELKPEFFVNGRNTLPDVMKMHKGGGLGRRRQQRRQQPHLFQCQLLLLHQLQPPYRLLRLRLPPQQHRCCLLPRRRKCPLLRLRSRGGWPCFLT